MATRWLDSEPPRARRDAADPQYLRSTACALSATCSPRPAQFSPSASATPARQQRNMRLARSLRLARPAPHPRARRTSQRPAGATAASYTSAVSSTPVRGQLACVTPASHGAAGTGRERPGSLAERRAASHLVRGCWTSRPCRRRRRVLKQSAARIFICRMANFKEPTYFRLVCRDLSYELGRDKR
jgi:hypothetical protein